MGIFTRNAREIQSCVTERAEVYAISSALHRLPPDPLHISIQLTESSARWRVEPEGSPFLIMIRHRPFAAFALVFAAVVALPAHAQSTGQDPRKEAKAHLGPLYLTPTFSLTNLGVDSNVFSESANSKSDFTFVLTPGSEIAMPIARRALLASKLSLDFAYFQKYATQRSINPNVDVRGEFYMSRITLFGQETYLSTKLRQNFEIDLRSRQRQNLVQGGFEIKFSPRSSVQIAAGAGRQRFDSAAIFRGTSLQLALDHNTISYSATFRSQRTPKTTLLVLTEVSHDRFLYAGFRNSDSVRILPGVEFTPRALISGKATVGLRRFHALSPTVPSFTGLVASLNLGYTLLGATRFSMQADRDVSYSYERAQPYYLVNGLGFSVRRQLFGDYDAIISGSKYQYSYRTDSMQVAPAALAETTTNYSLDVGHRLGTTSRLGLAVSKWSRHSGLGADRNYEGWRYGLSFTYGQ